VIPNADSDDELMILDTSTSDTVLARPVGAKRSLDDTEEGTPMKKRKVDTVEIEDDDEEVIELD